MTSYNRGAYLNPAYHDSDTLEVDRRYSRKPQHANPYPREDPSWRGDRAEAPDRYMGPTLGGDEALWSGPRGGWQRESRRGADRIPMGLVPARPESPSWHHDHNHSTFQINPDSQYDPSPSLRLPSTISGSMSVRWRGITARRMSMFPNTDPAYIVFAEDAMRNEMEREEQTLVNDLVAMSPLERIRTIRELPKSFGEKKHIRNQVLESSKRSRHFTCFADCSENISLFFRRCGYGVRSARQTLQPWQGIMKEIGGRFGTSVLSYFAFLKWLLMFNVFSFLINFGFITIPLLVYDPWPNIPPGVSFRGLEILSGAGYFTYTVMYYGSYSNETFAGQVEYNMQLAYFFTIALYMVLCGVVLIFSMAQSFRANYVLAEAATTGAWQLLCSWDFSVTNERAVRQRKNNLRVQLQESLSEKAQRELLTPCEKLRHFGLYLGCWLLSTSLAVGCGASIFYLCLHQQQRVPDAAIWTPLQEAETLLVPFVVSLMNLVVPLLYSLFSKFEPYSNQRRQIYTLVIRNVILRMSILGVLCYYWMNVVAKNFSCWESIVGQALYRLVIFDFFFVMLGSFFGEFLSRVLGKTLLPCLGTPEFDIARNVLELIYAQTLIWFGIYFSPLLPTIQILKCFILFYLKKVSLTQNCQPPRRTGRAAQMQTTFIALLFFPFFVGALSMLAYTAWRLTPSEECGPFRGLNNTFSVVGEWIDDLEQIPGADWVVWIYENVIRSEIFYFLVTLIILVIIYMFWQVTRGRQELIGLLKQQLVNEGKDKSFLLERLQNLQASGPNKKPKHKNHKKSKRRPDDAPPGGQSNSNAMLQSMLARQQLEEDEEQRRFHGGVPVTSDISASSALMQAMLARQRAEDLMEDAYGRSEPSDALAQARQARQRAELQEEDGYFSENPRNSSSALTQAMRARQRMEDRTDDNVYDPASSVSSVIMQVMQARQRTEEEEGQGGEAGRGRSHWVTAQQQNSVHSGSSALIQAMLARQQAQNEFDDGY